jgi:Domain of unknown function (DUF1854)
MSESFELIRDSRDRLTLRRAGQEDVPDVRVRRSFPWSDPDRHISIRNAEGKELLLIDDLATVDSAQRKIIDETLSNTVFIPKIKRVTHVDVRFGYQEWKVETDRGPIEFRVQEREDIRFHNDGRFSLKDADGNIYEMPPMHKLDDLSRTAIEALL